MLLKTARPPEHVVQWPDGFTVEDVVGWILGKEESLVPVIQAETPTAPATIGDIVTWIKTPTNQKGAKADFLAYEAMPNHSVGDEVTVSLGVSTLPEVGVLAGNRTSPGLALVT